MLIDGTMRTSNMTYSSLTRYNKKFSKTVEQLVGMQKKICFFVLGTVIFRNRSRIYLALLSKMKTFFSIRALDRFKMGLTPNPLVHSLLTTPHTVCRIQHKCGLKIMTLFLGALCLPCLMARIQRNMVFPTLPFRSTLRRKPYQK